MEEDITSELPCTLAIEDATEDSVQANKTDQVSFSHYCSKTKETVLNILPKTLRFN